MSDLFHEKLPSEFIAKILAVVGDCPRHTFQVLTKRPERMREIMRDLCAFAGIVEPPKNLWLGVSVEDQATADERIPLLLQTPAAVRFVSYEPALGPVDFRCLQHNREFEIDSLTAIRRPPAIAGSSDSKLNWIIAGGESGPHARPSHPDWFRSVRDQCAAAGVPFFFKQWGEWAEVDGGHPNRVFDVDKVHCPIDRLTG